MNIVMIQVTNKFNKNITLIVKSCYLIIIQSLIMTYMILQIRGMVFLTDRQELMEVFIMTILNINLMKSLN
jgi:hypothetical protein